MLHEQGVEFDAAASVSKLRKVLCHHAHTLQKGKQTPVRTAEQERCHGAKDVVREAHLNQTCNQWPQIAPNSLKAKMAALFHKETSSEMLCEKVCVCCAKSVQVMECDVVPARYVELKLLKHPTSRLDLTWTESKTNGESNDAGFDCLDPDCAPPEFPLFKDIPDNMMLELAGMLSTSGEEEVCLQLCNQCAWLLEQKKCCGLLWLITRFWENVLQLDIY